MLSGIFLGFLHRVLLQDNLGTLKQAGGHAPGQLAPNKKGIHKNIYYVDTRSFYSNNTHDKHIPRACLPLIYNTGSIEYCAMCTVYRYI